MSQTHEKQTRGDVPEWNEEEEGCQTEAGKLKAPAIRFVLPRQNRAKSLERLLHVLNLRLTPERNLHDGVVRVVRWRCPRLHSRRLSHERR